jgi:hypothetical protein
VPRGGKRPGAGRPRGPDILRELCRIEGALDRLHQQRRDEAESFVPILRRLRAIEERLGIAEVPKAPRPTGRRPLDA